MKQLNVVPEKPATSSPEDLALTSKGWLFPTIQGEGSLIGTPSLFLRLYGCNLACAACDTTYSWKNPEDNQTVVPVEEVRRQIHEHLKASRIDHLVITGGEPTLQADALCILLAGLDVPVHVTLETNGMIFHQALSEYISLVSLSPKLGMMSFGLEELSTANMAWLAWAVDHDRQSQVKLVAEDCEQAEQACGILRELWQKGWISEMGAILQPEWYQWGANVKPFLDVALKYGVRVIPQCHKAFGVL